MSSRDTRGTRRALEGHSKGTPKALEGHLKGTQRALKGHLKGTQRALRHSNGIRRALKPIEQLRHSGTRRALATRALNALGNLDNQALGHSGTTRAFEHSGTYGLWALEAPDALYLADSFILVTSFQSRPFILLLFIWLQKKYLCCLYCAGLHKLIPNIASRFVCLDIRSQLRHEGKYFNYHSKKAGNFNY